jgi:HAD superfamily hydrolase (TIGR01509 family)
MQSVLEHIIFDCDGVLVDSEMLSASVLQGMMAEIGLPITEEIFRCDFLGRSFANAAALAGTRFGTSLPDDFQLRYRERLLDRMRLELQPMPGVFAMLEGLSTEYWLATSSSPQRLELSLQLTGLNRFFGQRCSTASEVANGKPAPDLLLHAARRAGFEPSVCLVVEDSEMGIRAARAAGMPVWHFAGGSHVKAGYCLPADAPADLAVADMGSLAAALKAAGLGRGSELRLG